MSPIKLVRMEAGLSCVMYESSQAMKFLNMGSLSGISTVE
jgi:hypothetical protein